MFKALLIEILLDEQHYDTANINLVMTNNTLHKLFKATFGLQTGNNFSFKRLKQKNNLFYKQLMNKKQCKLYHEDQKHKLQQQAQIAPKDLYSAPTKHI